MRRRRGALGTGSALVALLAAVPAARAQVAAATPAAGVQPEARIDLLAGARSAVQAGVGLQLPVGLYVRVGTDVVLGVRTGAAGDGRLDGRVDMLGRFLLDPFRQSPYGVSAGAGLTARLDPGARVIPLLLVAIEVEGHRRASGWVPAVQLGLGGGARIGIVLRGASTGYR